MGGAIPAIRIDGIQDFKTVIQKRKQSMFAQRIPWKI
jgi:hypothetical protein